MRKIFFVFFFSLLLVYSPLFAASFHPYYGWRTIDTDHFSIHYHFKIEDLANRSAQYLEEAHEQLSPKYQWKPWGKTQVVLTDNNDDANGMASTLPYNWLLLRVVPPQPEDSLSTYDDWLKTLIFHEYTHILHLDAYGGFWRPFRWILGKMVTPAGLTPGWIREGTATLEETLGTEGGRGRASYSEMLIRTAVLENKFPTIDKAAGVHWSWPGSQTQYIFGVKFLQYLKDRFGEDKLQAFHRRTQNSFFISAVNKQAKKVFGKSFYQLWQEWQEELKKQYASWEQKDSTPLEAFLAGEDNLALPTFSKDGKQLAYIRLNPHRAPQIIVRDLATGQEKLAAKKVPSQMSFSPDGHSLVFAALGSHKRYYFYYDLYQVDLQSPTPKPKPLTQGERARDPDWHPWEKKILFVASEGGTDQLKIYDVETKKVTALVSRVKPHTQFAHPRYSPDGSKLVVVRWMEPHHLSPDRRSASRTRQVVGEGEGWELVIADADGKIFKKISPPGFSVVSRPTWGADAETVIYSSDEEGVSNLYLYDLKKDRTQRLTEVKTGLFQPAFAPSELRRGEPDGQTLLARHYHGEGYEIVKGKVPGTFLQNSEGRRDVSTRQVPLQKSSIIQKGARHLSNSLTPSLHKYTPFGQSLFLPRYIAPGFFALDNGLLLSVATSAHDPLGYHNWAGGGTYRTDARYLGYFGRYYYNRFLPLVGLGIDDFAVDYGTITFARTRNSYHFFEQRRRGSVFLSLPLGKGHSAGGSYFYEDRIPVTNITRAEAGDLNLGIFSGMNFDYYYGSAESYSASISPIEKGRTVRAGLTVTDGNLGANQTNEQRIWTADYREFVPLGKNHVLAFRLAGGAALGDRIFPGTFSLGGALGEGVMASQYSSRYYSLRGLPVGTLIRDRVMISSLEYRIPLVSPQRGVGTWPLFLNNLHLGLFSDLGDAWNNSPATLEDFFDNFLVSVGLETRADFVIGHGLPVTGRLGYAIIVANRDRLGTLSDPLLGNRVSKGIFILQFGTAF